MSQEQDRLYSPPPQYAKSESSSISEDSQTSTESDLSLLPPAPDGGYGWIIVLSSFVIMLISDGIAFSFGLLYNALLDEFNESKSLTSWVGSIFYGVPLLCGPIASAMATKYGCRKATIFGGIVASLGFLISSQVNSIGMLCFFFGIVGGFGISMGCVTSVVMVAFYFRKKRAFATGLAVCGTGIGTFLFAPLMEYSINEYGWRGALIIISGIVLNITVCGALYRPLVFTPEQKRQRALEAFEKKSRSLSRASLPSISHPSRHNSDTDSVTDNKDTAAKTVEHWSYSQIHLPTYCQNTPVPQALLDLSRRNGSNLQQMIQQYINNLKTDGQDNKSKNDDALGVTRSGKIVFAGSNAEQAGSSCSACAPEFVDIDEKIGDNVCNRTEVWKLQQKRRAKMRFVECLPMYRKDLFYRGNLMRLPGSKLKTASCPVLFINTFQEEEDSLEEDSKHCFEILRFSKHVKKLLRMMVDCSLFFNSLFMLYAVSNFILYFWYDVPYVFVTDRAIENGISETNATFIISILGIVNTVGQILYGLIGDQPINLTLFYGLSIILAGLSVLLVPLFSDYISQCVLSGTYGLFISANYALSTVILVEFLSIDKLTNAYGLTMLMQGLANLLGPPVAGWLYDKTLTYDATFYSGGAFIMLSGLLMVLVPMRHCALNVCSTRPLESSRSMTESQRYRSVPELVTEIETAV
ncbi:hypothetical protein ScPMuIL_004778 [Solemya velum]